MSRPDVETRRVRALSARTHFVPGFGQVTFDHQSKREELRFPDMPVEVIDMLVDRGWIADDAPSSDEAPAASKKPGRAASRTSDAPSSDEAPAA